MNRYLKFLLILLLPLGGWAQNFELGNDWYKSDPNRPFAKLVVTETGVYRVSLQDLTDAGFDLSAVNPASIQLFHRGQEVPVYLSVVNGQLNFIEFFGRRNDGRIDSLMYRDPVNGTIRSDLQPDIEYSIFTDESAYFLTWSAGFGLRYFSQFDPTYSLYTPESSFRYRAKLEYTYGSPGTIYVRGGGNAFDSFYTLNSDYVTGEGYMGPGFGFGSPRTVTISTPAPANNGSSHLVRARVFGRSSTQHILRVDLNGDQANPIIDSIYNVPQVYIRTYRNTTTATLSDETELTFNALRANTDNNNIAWADIWYDRLPDFRGDSALFIRNFAKASKAYFRLEDVAGDDTVFVYDLTNGFRNVGLIETVNGQQVGNVIIQNFPNTRDLFVTTDRAIGKPRIEPARLNRLFDPANDAEFVIIANRSLSASAQAYKAYRDTSSVNPLKTKIVYTDEINDEYGYGSLTPWAIKRFCYEALRNWSSPPKHFLLWGKGHNEPRRYNTPTLVVTYGYPATDYEYVGHFDENSNRLNLEAGIGRVNLYNDAEGLTYLEKVIEYENSPWQGWMKKGVFLGGGATVDEQDAISSGMDEYVGAFEGIPFGGTSIRFQKTSSNLVDPTTASYHDEISKGSHIIHFFGHSTNNIQDISIKEPFEYDNIGRYPLMMAFGCYGGDFTEGESFGERWVKFDRRGSIGYIANSSAGYLGPLRDFGRLYYRYAYIQYFGLAMGEINRRIANKFSDSLNTVQYRNHARQLNLQGDPSLALYNVPKPDLAVTNADVFFLPENFSAQDDSFQINIAVSNLGLAIPDSFRVSIKQRWSGSSVDFEHPSIKAKGVLYRDTLTAWLQNPAGNSIAGLNTFEILVDADNVYDELTKDNNLAQVDVVIPGNVPAIIAPVEYAVIPDNEVTLVASAFFMTQDTGVNYLFELDTLPSFDSPFRISSGTVKGSAVQATWDPPLVLQPNQVYFWRVRLADVTPVVWGDASFRYEPGKEGWSQGTIIQFRKNPLFNTSLDLLHRVWKYAEIGQRYDLTVVENSSFEYYINGSLKVNLFLSGFSGDGVGFQRVDQYSLQPEISSNLLGDIGAARSPSELYRLRDAILNTPEGDYFFVGSNRNPRVPEWSDDIFQALEQIGASDNIRALADEDRFVIFGRKGYPGSAIEVLAPNVGNRYTIEQFLSTTRDTGWVATPVIGPAINWQELSWQWKSNDQVVQEDAWLTAYALRPDNSDSLMFRTQDFGPVDISQLDAARFPRMRVEVETRDTVFLTPPQLNDVTVLYTPVPDAAVDPVTNFEFRSDSVFEGEDVFIRLAARNLTTTDMDSLLVAFRLERSDRTQLELGSIRTAPPLGDGQAVPFEFTFNTENKDLEGAVNLIVEINPEGDQPEQHQFNNLYFQPFTVVRDRINPILDVTFDGKYIANNDIVSPRPEILVQVNDENPLQALDDTTTFEVYLREGTSLANPFQRIFLSDPRVEWQPAQLPENKARLYFFPGKEQPLSDGLYTLRVQGRDKNGNLASKNGTYYEVTFEVVNETSVTKVLNYPNPFSTSTRFVYTLTGENIPEVFQIHIYTITGKLVKVIDLLALGEARIGNNITNYAWDGTDDYGDKLANGVYVYRVVTRGSGEQYDLRETAADQYFKNGWGKMYIMR